MKKEKRLQKVLTIVCAVAFAFSLTGCNTNGDINPDKYIELGQYKGINVEKAVHEVTDEELEDELNTLVSSYATNEKIEDGEVQFGDIANIDYVGKKDGTAFDGGTADGYDLKIGSGQFIPGFEDGLIGVSVGETVDLPLTFPSEYHSAELAGADVIFTVTVNYISRPIIPEVTDDFINEISQGQYKTVDDYMIALEAQIVSEYEEYNELQYYEDLWNVAVDNATVIKDLPSEFVNEKTSRMVINAQEYAKSMNLNFDDFLQQYMGLTKEQFYAQSAEYASKAAKESLVLKAIAKKENITVSEEELKKAIDEYVELGQYESEEEFRRLSKIEDLEEYILTSKVQDFIAENAVNK